MTMIDKEAREERRRLQREGAARLKASGVMDELFAKIYAGEVELDGRDGLIQQMIKTGLERGLQAELTEHLGYERGDAEAALFPNSRNGAFPKTVTPTLAISSWRSSGTGMGRSCRRWRPRAHVGSVAWRT